MTREEIENAILEGIEQDEAFWQQLQREPQTAWQQLYGDTPLGELTLRLLENSAETRYVVVPVGDNALITELETSPRTVWKRYFGTANLKGQVVRVVLEQPREFVMVLPIVESAEDKLKDVEQRYMQDWITDRTQSEENSRHSQRPSLKLNKAIGKHKQQLEKEFGQLRPDKAKLSRIATRGKGLGKRMVLYHPVVRKTLRPLHRARRLLFFWQRL